MAIKRHADHERGWFQSSRSNDAWELAMGHPVAFKLAWIIAWRAKYTNDHERYDLALGECFLGDWKTLEFKSEMEYRYAKKVLTKFKFATFKGTGSGTTARLIDNRLFSNYYDDSITPRGDCIRQQNRQQNTLGTPSQQADNTLGTTNEDSKKENTERQRDNDGKTPAVASDLGSQGSYFDEEYLKSLNLPESIRRRDAETAIDPETRREWYLDTREWVSDFQWPMLTSDPRHPLHRAGYVPPLFRPVDPAMKAMVDALDPNRPFVNSGGEGWQDHW